MTQVRFGAGLAPALGVHSSAAVPRPAASSFMLLRCAHQAPELRLGMVEAQRWIAKPFARAGRWCTQRSGIKEAAAALGRNGGSLGADYTEGRKAFMEKRKPVFVGK